MLLVVPRVNEQSQQISNLFVLRGTSQFLKLLSYQSAVHRLFLRRIRLTML